MIKTLHVPDEPRFVQAQALAVDPADTLSFLFEVGALRDRDLGIVRWVRDAQEPAYEAASVCTCSEPGSPKALAGDHTAWCSTCCTEATT